MDETEPHDRVGGANSTSRSYLFALTDGGGTVPPELGVAHRLIDRGHRVTALADEAMAEQVRRAGAAFVPWTSSWGQFQDWELKTPGSLLRGMVDQMLLGPAPGQAGDTAAAIDAMKPDLVLTSFPSFGAMIAAEARGLPFDVLLPNAYPLPATGMPPFGAGLSPARGPLGRLRDRVATAASTGLFDRYALGRINALRAEYSLEPIAHSWDQIHRARRELILTSAAFDFPAALPENARYVGPVLDDPSWAADEAWTPPTGEGPLVLVAFSSTFQNQAECLQRIVDALGTLPVRGLVTTGPAVPAGAIQAPANVTVTVSAPHRKVMRHANLVVAHGGHGTVVKSLAAGLPLVILHHGRDQADNAVRVTARGAGVAVSRRASAQKIARAVSEVLDDDRYRRAAAQLGDAVARDADNNTLLDEIEQLAPAGSQRPRL